MGFRKKLRVRSLSFSIKQKLMLVLCVFSVLPLLGFFLYSNHANQIEYVTKEKSASFQNVSAINLEVDKLITKDIAVLQMLATNPIIKDYQNQSLTDTIRPILLQTNKLNPELQPVILDDATGQQLVKSDESAMNKIADRDYFQNAVKNKGVAISDVIVSKSNGHSIIIIALPVFSDKDSSIIGVMQATIDLEILTEFVNKLSVNNATAFILDRQGIVIGHPNKEMNAKDFSKETFAKNAMAGKEEAIVQQVNGVDMVVAYVKNKQTGWYIGYQIPYDIVMKNNQIMARNAIVILIVTLVVAVALGYFISNIGMRPIKKLVDASSQIAQGDLTVQVDVKDKSEFGQLANSFNTMVANLRNIIQTVSDGAMHVAASSGQIKTSIQGIASGSTNQANNAQTMSELFKELSAAINTVAKSAEQAAELSNKTMDIAKEGGQVIQSSIEGMNMVNEQMSRLENDSNKIGEIIEVIDDIAEQTNLLALNAAIEAARAGEQGRGFAVVADEVRKLAERSGEATKQITAIIKGMQQNTHQSVKAVGEGVASSQKTGEAFEHIIEMVNESANKVTEIAAGSEQQAAQSSEVLVSIESISAATQQAAASSEETVATVQSLSQLADKLNVSVSAFKI